MSTSATYNYPSDYKPPITTAAADLAPSNPFSTPSTTTSAQQQPCSSWQSASPSSPPSGGQAASSSAPSRSHSSATARSATEKQLSKAPEPLSLFPSRSTSRVSTTKMPPLPPRAHQPRVNEALHHQHHGGVGGGSYAPRSSSPESVGTTQGSDSADEAPPPSYVAATGGANAGKAAAPPRPGRKFDGSAPGPWKPMVEATPLHMLGTQEAVVDCPHCGARGMSRTTKHSGKYTCLASMGLGTLCCALAVLPCMTHLMADTEHECSRCGRELARKRYQGKTEVLAVVPGGVGLGIGYVPMSQMR